MRFNTTLIQFDTKSQFRLVSPKDKSDNTATKFSIYGMAARFTIRNPAEMNYNRYRYLISTSCSFIILAMNHMNIMLFLYNKVSITRTQGTSS